MIFSVLVGLPPIVDEYKSNLQRCRPQNATYRSIPNNAFRTKKIIITEYLIIGNKNCLNYRPDDNRLEKNLEINRTRKFRIISYRHTKTTAMYLGETYWIDITLNKPFWIISHVSNTNSTFFRCWNRSLTNGRDSNRTFFKTIFKTFFLKNLLVLTSKRCLISIIKFQVSSPCLKV